MLLEYNNDCIKSRLNNAKSRSFSDLIIQDVSGVIRYRYNASVELNLCRY